MNLFLILIKSIIIRKITLSIISNITHFKKIFFFALRARPRLRLDANRAVDISKVIVYSFSMKRDELILQITSILQSLSMSELERLHKAAIPCRHNNGKKKGESFHCIDCKTNLGWFCKESPDLTCHYYTESYQGKNMVKLSGGSFYEYKGKFHDPEFETEDRCLFCGDPEERK